MMNELYTMKPIVLENGVIKPIIKFDDFSDIIDVFKEPPYGEPLTLFDKIDEYNGYVYHGLALGYYNNEGEIMGYAGLMDEVEDEHSPYFHEGVKFLTPLYIYGLATKSQFRGHGVCSTLVKTVNELAKKQQTDFIYLRINDSESMSESLCRKQGYGDLYQDGEIVLQDVSDVDGKISENTLPSANLRRFLIMPITDKGEKFLSTTGSIKKTAKGKTLVKTMK